MNGKTGKSPTKTSSTGSKKPSLTTASAPKQPSATVISLMHPDPMLLNLSNHPTSTWQAHQLALAQQQYSRVQDLPFPSIDPSATEADLKDLAQLYLQKIQQIRGQYAKECFAVHIMGELTFAFLLVQHLQALGITCIASTTLRQTQQKDQRKISTFQFVQFRSYPMI